MASVCVNKQNHPKCQFVVDLLSIALAGFPSLALLLTASPTKRGFYCDDQSLMHPYKQESVPVAVVGVIAAVIPSISVVLIETFKKNRRCKINKHTLFQFRRILIPYFFGCCLSQLMTDIAKYYVGRLRPHFLTVCDPALNVCTSTTGFITDDNICNGTNVAAIKQARLSFPSGHASMSFYSMVWTIIYIQWRFCWLEYWLVKPMIQGMLFVTAYVISLSRIYDYYHHWSDVFAGSILGIITALLAFFLFTDKRILRTTSDSLQVNHKSDRTQTEAQEEINALHTVRVDTPVNIIYG